MQTYLVVRRSAWDSAKEQRDADARSTLEAARMADEIASLRSYALEERDQTIGAVCIYEASSPEAVRRHAAAAGLPVDEIVKVADTVVGDPSRLHSQPERGEG
jgi:Nickel responsive protein SCO4226-like